MKRFALCFALVSILALAVLIYSNSQAEAVGPDSMEGTKWTAYVFAFDSATGGFLYWFEDTFSFSRGIFCIAGMPSPDNCAPYGEFEISQGTIWGSKIEWPTGEWWHFKGIRPSGNPDVIVGNADSNVGMYFKFFGKKIAADAEGKKATPDNWRVK
jgi:hypothetical protein